MDLSAEIRKIRVFFVVLGFAAMAVGFLLGVVVTRWIE